MQTLSGVISEDGTWGPFGIDITPVKDLGRLFYSRHVNAMGL
jgi:hypothetical protein